MRKPLAESFIFALVAWLMLDGINAAAYVTSNPVILPPNYFTFVPPAARVSFKDPVFGTTITRLSDGQYNQRGQRSAVALGGSGVFNEITLQFG